jgi:glycosyltransferase involved in cell wall biosynthesis
MTVSVIVTVFNRPDALRACLGALALGRCRPDQVVVSDDGSEPDAVDAMKAALANLPFPTAFVTQPHQGFRLAAARNNAIRAAAGDYLVSLDCDILLLPDALDAHLALARPGRFLAGNRALLSEADAAELGRHPLDAAALERAWTRADRSHLARAHRQFLRNALLRRLGLAQPHKPKILGCHFSLFRADAERVNGFDENFVGWGLEDDDFARRLHLAGVRGRSVIRDARALHLGHAPAQSKPAEIAGSPNRAYFDRPGVESFCRRGLR